MNLENFPTSEAAVRMLDSVSNGFYDKSYVGKWMYQVMGLEMDEVRKIFTELPYQAFPETATWGLRYHEQKYVLPVRENLPYEERRKYIYNKRDIRTPMNPYRMEVILGNTIGRKVHVDDESGPVNTLAVEVESGENAVDVTTAIKRLKAIKQSHVSFTLRFTSVAYLEIGTRTEKYKQQYTLCGTVPDLSTQLRTLKSTVLVSTSGIPNKAHFPMAGNSGEAGLYPKTSRGLKVAGTGTEIDASGNSQAVKYQMTGEDLKTGTNPMTSRRAVITKAEIEADLDAEVYRFQNPVAGTKPGTSWKWEVHETEAHLAADSDIWDVQYDLTGNTESGINPVVNRRLAVVQEQAVIETEGKGQKIKYELSGTVPITSNGVGQSDNSMIPEVETETFAIRYPLCGNTFEI